MSPKNASMKKNKTIVWINFNSINNLNSEPIKAKFSVGNKVRITKKKTTFEKSYTARWSEEIFTVTKILYRPTDPRTYKISDYNGEEIQGTKRHFTNRSYKKPLKKFLGLKK